jgi:NitT/TauT family transport system ATP-binding protein
VLDLSVRTKSYPRPDGSPQVVLRDIRFTAAPGTVIALLGRSGAGKSTLLRIALGIDRNFTGQVTLPAGRTGVVFQEPRLLPWLTIAENLNLVVTEGVPAPDIAALLAIVGIPDAGRSHPAELSLGMARRVAIARALAVDPAFLVLDEPFVSLDRQLGTMLGGLLTTRARHHGTLVLVATHDLEHALAIADRVLVLHGNPAVLAADEAVPDRDDPAALARLRGALLTQFAFLGAEETQDASASE